MSVQIPEVNLSENNPYSHGFILVLGDEQDIVLKADPLNYTKSVRDRYYTVSQGDTLNLIAFLAYGDDRDWRKIADANNIKNPLVLNIGDTLLIPDAETSRIVNQD